MKFRRAYVIRQRSTPSRIDGIAAIDQLAKGNVSGTNDLNEIRDLLAKNASRTLARIMRIVDHKEFSNYYLLPYLARVLLEASTTVALSRLDPFRVLLIKKAQQSADYDVTKRSMLAVEWGRDIITKDGTDDARWTSTKGPETYSRALLDSVWAALSWGEAIVNAADACRTATGDWAREIRNNDSNTLWRFLRGQCGQLYSDLSKHVHVEFLHTDQANDTVGITEKTLRTIKVSTLVLYTSNFIAHSSGCLEKELAVKCLVAAQNSFSGI